jgi:hypothetical protein
MDNPRPPLTPEHRQQLRDFVRLVDDMSRSRFIETYRTQDHTISSDLDDDGTSKITAPDYDWEDFRSFLTVFRQVAISQNESIYFTKILNTVGRYASDELREKIGEMRTPLITRLEGRYRGMMFGKETSEGPEISLTSHDILDALVNGQIFHNDGSHREAVEFLNASERWQYLCPLLGEIVIPALRDFIWLFKAIRSDGILEDADYPARCRGTGT